MRKKKRFGNLRKTMVAHDKYLQFFKTQKWSTMNESHQKLRKYWWFCCILCCWQTMLLGWIWIWQVCPPTRWSALLQKWIRSSLQSSVTRSAKPPLYLTYPQPIKIQGLHCTTKIFMQQKTSNSKLFKFWNTKHHIVHVFVYNDFCMFLFYIIWFVCWHFLRLWRSQRGLVSWS